MSSDASSFLTEEEIGKVRLFAEMAGIEDEHLCIQIMQSNGFDVERAISEHLNLGDSGGMDMSSSASSGPVQRRGGGSGRGNGTSSGTANGTTNGSNGAMRNQSNGGSLAFASNPFLGRLLSSIRWLLSPRINVPNYSLDAQIFSSNFDRSYDITHPTFQLSAYPDAVRTAYHQGKFMLVYLHSPMHEKTDSFCRNVLCQPSIQSICDQNMVSWGGNVHDAEGYTLAMQFDACAFPFLALVVCRSENKVEIVTRVQGQIHDHQQLHEHLRNVMLVHQPSLHRVRAQQQQRTEERSLREEQDRAYLESEQQDRINREKREREAKDERERIEQQQRQATEEAELQLQSARDLKAHVQKKRATMALEPPAGQDVAILRFQLPSSGRAADGQNNKILRRFARDATVQELYDWLEVLLYDRLGDENATRGIKFQVSSAYPKADLLDMSATVEEVGLHPRGMLMVQDLDL